MKKIYYILVALLCLQACNNDSDENFTPDTIALNVTGQIPEEDGKIFNAGDGNWGVNIKPEYAGKIDIAVQTDKPWKAELEYITVQDEEWIALSEAEGNGNTTVSLNVEANKSVRFRKACIRIRTAGEIPAYKTLTIIQTDSEPIIEFVPEGDVNYDPETKILSVGYNNSILEISIWSNIEDYTLKVEPIEEGADISWVQDFKLEQGKLTFTTDNNFTGAARKANIIFASDEFQDVYTLEQIASLYRNILVSVDGETSGEIISHGNYGMKARTIELTFDADKPLAAEVIDLKTSAAATWATASVDDKIVKIVIPLNDGEETREAVVKVKAADAEFAAQKPVEWMFAQSHETLNVNWIGTLDDKLVFGPNERTTGVDIASFTSADEIVEVTATATWLTPTVEDGKIKLAMSSNAGGQNPRTAQVTVKNANGVLSKTVSVQQYAVETLTPKSNWTIEAANSKTTAYRNDPFTNIIDGNINTHWQWDWPNGSNSDFPNTPYEFDIDFSSEQILNTIALWQTQTAVNGYVKDVQFKVSNDKQNWTDLGVYRMSESTEAAKAHGANPYIYSLNGAYKARYVRLIILSNVGGSSVNSAKNAYMGEFDAYLK